MRPTNWILAAVLFLDALALSAAQRTFVSAAAGSDANPCTRSAPCRSFDVALVSTDPGGEVVALDSGGYGPFTVSQAVRIEAPSGIAAAVSVFSGTGIVFNGGSTDRIIVRGLQLSGLGGVVGFGFESGASAHLDHVVFTGFSAIGVSAINGGILTIREAAFVGNQTGLQIGNGPSLTRAVVSRSRFHGNTGHAAAIYSNGEIAVSDSIYSGNTIAMLAFAFAPTSIARGVLDSCVVSNNALGLQTQGSGTATIRVSGSAITHNDTALDGTGILSRVNNTLQGNANDGSFGGTFAAD